MTASMVPSTTPTSTTQEFHEVPAAPRVPHPRPLRLVTLLTVAAVIAAFAGRGTLWATPEGPASSAAESSSDPHLIILGPNNFINNPDFDTNLDGWLQAVPATGGILHVGANGDPGGAVFIASPTTFGATSLFQCVNLSKDWASLNLSTSVNEKVLGSATSGGYGRSQLVAFSQPDCAGTVLGIIDNASNVDNGTYGVAGTNPLSLPTLTQSVQFALQSANTTIGKESNVIFDNAFLGVDRETGKCGGDASLLCVNENRFQISAKFSQACSTNGSSASGDGVQTNAAGGYLWCFDPGNPELFVKVLNACSAATGNTYWVFIAGLTNLGVTVTVTDTKTGTHKTYTNPSNTNFIPIFDTEGLAVCP
jgi:hypothetical protein